MKRSADSRRRKGGFRLGCELLEVRRVLDASAMPVWDSVPVETSAQSLTLDEDFPVTANAQFGDFTYTTSNGAVTITGYTGAGGAVVIPAEIDGMPVRVLVPAAFVENATITSISVPRTVTSIGNNAFAYCERLETITVDAANADYASVGGILFNKAVTDLLRCPVAKAGAISIPASVRNIATDAFDRCSNVTSIVLPNGLQSIGFNAFRSCSGITSITVPASVSSILTGAFLKCVNLSDIVVDPANTVYASVNGILFNKTLTTLIQCPGAKTGAVTIPSSVSELGSGAFYGVRGMTSVTMPSVLRTIGGSAFIGCTGLQAVTVPGSVRNIGIFMFFGCTSLTTVTIGNGVTGLGLGMFDSCTNLTSVSLPGTLTSISDQAFKACENLRSITIPSAVTSIGYGAFSRCNALTTITIPASVTTIKGSNGDSMSNAFSASRNLTNITVDPANTAFASLNGILYNKSLTSLIQVPGGKQGIVSLPGSVTRIGDYAFAGCEGISSVSVPEGVTFVGIRAFAGCINLTSIDLPGSVVTLGESSFEGSGLTSIAIPSGVMTIGPWAFARSPALVSVSIPDTVTTIGFQAFDACPELATVTVHGGTPNMRSDAFGTGTTQVVKKGSGRFVFSASNGSTGGVVVEEGELVLAHPNAVGGVLEVKGGAKVTIEYSYGPVIIPSLVLSNSARIELGTNRFAVPADGFTEAEIRAKLIAGRNGGSWDGVSGITSTDAGSGREVGYRVVDGAMEVAWAAPGDTNLDGKVDVFDLVAIQNNGKFNSGLAASWAEGDTNYDGVANVFDLTAVSSTNLFNNGDYRSQIVFQSDFAGGNPVESAAEEPVALDPIDTAFVFAALAMESESLPAGKRKGV